MKGVSVGAEETHISVVIPCYNSARFVRDAVASVEAQTCRPLELILVDDGSTDDTHSVLEEIRNSSPIPVTVVQQPNGGASSARNRGIQLAQGNYVQLLDSDDLLLPEKLEHQLRLIAEDGNDPDLVAADYADRYPNGSEISRRVDRRGPWYGLVGSRLGITSSNLWRTESIRREGYFNVDLSTSEEYEMMFRMLAAPGKVLLDTEELTVRRLRPNSLSRTAGSGFSVRYCELRRRILEHLEEHGLANSELRRLVNRQIFYRLNRLSRSDPQLAAELARRLLPRRYALGGYGPRFRMVAYLLGLRDAGRDTQGLRTPAWG